MSLGCGVSVSGMAGGITVRLVDIPVISCIFLELWHDTGMGTYA